MKIQNSSLYGEWGELDRKRIALTKWLNKDVSTWSAGRVHAVYDTEQRKRNKIFMQEFLRS